jgi:hypothetical protein
VRKSLERQFPIQKKSLLLDVHTPTPVATSEEGTNIGWTKGRELAKLARAEGQDFDCAPWVHKARSMPREEFAREVEKELTRRESEPSKLIYFKVYKSQASVIAQAIETAALMLGSNKARGYCPEMICADFLAGAHLEAGSSKILLLSITRLFQFLPAAQRQEFLQQATEAA